MGASPPDRFDLYERCVQSAEHIARFLVGAHGGRPRRLREDFCGTAAVARWWAEHTEGGTAVAVDIDGPTLRRARELARRSAERIEFIEADVLAESPEAAPARVDAVFCGNFSIGYALSRRELLGYLRRTRGRLAPGGIFACDTYGGATAFKLGALERTIVTPEGRIIRYTWSHDAADPLTGLVENSISFRLEAGGVVVQEMPRAFVYRWRLWSIAELREAMAEAGFASGEVYAEIGPDGAARPVSSPGELGEDWTVLIVGRSA